MRDRFSPARTRATHTNAIAIFKSLPNQIETNRKCQLCAHIKRNWYGATTDVWYTDKYHNIISVETTYCVKQCCVNNNTTTPHTRELARLSARKAAIAHAQRDSTCFKLLPPPSGRCLSSVITHRCAEPTGRTCVRMMRTAVGRRQSGHEPPVGFGRVVQRSAQPEHGTARRRFLSRRQPPRYAADGHQNDANAWNEKIKKTPSSMSFSYDSSD